jgi:hypothetical protein
MKKCMLVLVVAACWLLSVMSVFAGDLTCYGYTSKTSHFECGIYGNCTWWAAYKRPDIAVVVSGSGWNGGQWYDNLSSQGFDVSRQTPKVGAIVEFSGHVAYVESLGENGSFNVSEMDATGSLGSGVMYATYSPNGETYKRNGSGSWTLKGFIYRRTNGATNLYCDSISSIWGVCWAPSSNDVSCQGGSDWTLYDFEQGSVIRVLTNEYCLEPGGIGGSDGQDSTDTTMPNLQVRNITVFDQNGTTLAQKVSQVQVGQTLDVQTQLISLDSDASIGMQSGKDNVETDVFYKIALGDDDGSYKFFSRVYSEVGRLYEDNWHNEHSSFTIPPEAAGYRIYFRSKVDSTGEVKETNEHDNWSGPDEWYPVAGNCDLIISYARLTGGRTTLKEGDRYGFEMSIKNQGANPCPMSTRSAYYHQKPGQTTWDLVATDGTDVKQLASNQDNYEYIMDEPFTADTPGIHYVKACADYLGEQPELDENNNCANSSFIVIPHRPDFVVTSVGTKNGKTTLNFAENFGLQMFIKNQGTVNSPVGIRSAYYLKNPNQTTFQYITDDGSDASDLPVGATKQEATSTEPYVANISGTWEIMACADYQGDVLEISESNNCLTSSFFVNNAKPDFVVSDLYLVVNGGIYRNGSSFGKGQYVHPYCTVKNIGTSGIHSGFRLAYYINASEYRDSDGLDTNELPVGASKTEYVSGNTIKLGDTGARSYRCCVDYQGVVSELNENNNCATMTFNVK